MRLLIVGCGYVGLEVAKIAEDSWEVLALTRSFQRADALRDQNISPIVGNWLEQDSLVELPAVDFVLVSVPHRAAGAYEVATHCMGLSNLLRWLQPGCRKLLYLSTTGVYGQCDAELVTEDTPPSPTRIGPRMALRAEQWLGNADTNLDYSVLRLAGIYGPGRIPLADRIRAGEPLAVPQEGYLNLVHVRDIARMVVRVLQQQLTRDCYVFSDGQPVVRRRFYERLAELCGAAEPVFAEPDPHDPRVRRATSKRIDPSRLVTETGFEFSFPDYRVGLADAVERKNS